VELWITDVNDHVKAGGTIEDVKTALLDSGLERPSMIALWGYCEPDAGKYAAALAEMKKTLAVASDLGVQRIVVSPPREEVDLKFAGARYQEVLDLSARFDVGPSVEFLGFVAGINTVTKAWSIAASTADPRASITPDTFHIHRGGGKLEELETVDIDHVSIFHWNDVPAGSVREKLTDGDRILPGDGSLDLKGTAAYLKKREYKGFLSLELFNKDLWAKDPKEVAKLGLEKMRATVEG
jgi:sugar phosphate isomerase/epimerase